MSQTAGADRLHQIALEELGQSLASEVSPVVLEVGEVVELTGSAEKFRQWRIMKKLHDQSRADEEIVDVPGRRRNHGLTGPRSVIR